MFVYKFFNNLFLFTFQHVEHVSSTIAPPAEKPLVDYNVPIIKKHDLEMIKTWYNPPPISPDLPTLFYDDTGAIKHMPKPKHLPVPKHAGGGTTSPKFHTSGIKIQQPSANSVKGLSTSTSYDPRKNHYKNTGINMIHFGTDFSSSHKSSKNINGYHVSTLAPPTITQPPPHVNRLLPTLYGKVQVPLPLLPQVLNLFHLLLAHHIHKSSIQLLWHQLP